MRFRLTLAAMMLLSGVAIAGQSEVIEVSSPTELGAYFDSIGFNVRANPKILEAIPRTRFTRMPQNWDWNEGGIALKKSAFFRIAASGVLQMNEQILADRGKLEAMKLSSMTADDRAWFQALAERYLVDVKDLSSANRELLIRVDAIPVSLALAQVAVESGWGGSRFARKGNAVFGQWTPNGGMKAEGSEARIATFETPRDSGIAYMLNLNTHVAYAGLRKNRAAMRAAGQTLDGYVLASGLSSYAQTGQEYVDLLRSVIKQNGLGVVDGALLADTPVVMIDPVDPEN